MVKNYFIEQDLCKKIEKKTTIKKFIYIMELVSANNYNYKTWNEMFKNKIDIKTLIKKDEWSEQVFSKISSKEFDDINKKLNESLAQSIKEKFLFFPYPELLFSAFDFCSYDNVKVVIIGQDPYFNSKVINNKIVPEAMGLSFSVPVGIPIPSSLKNIFNNAVKYGHMKNYPKHGNLQYWSEQGCLMLNASLSLIEGKKNSHANIWNNFTDKIIQTLNEKNDGLVFVLWGSFAMNKSMLIDTNKHAVIISSHPSGLSNTKPLGKYPAFSNYDQFGQINKMLTKFGKKEIEWDI